MQAGKMTMGLRKMSGYDLFDGLVLSAEGADGRLASGWRLLRLGRNELKRNGRDFVLVLGAEDVASAVRFFREKGEKVPLDSRHALFLAARRAGVEEGEALRSVPQGVAALAFGDICEKDGDLWIDNVEWLPLAAELFRQGALRYFSPTVRGLDGKSPFRVTSVALDNVPSLCNLDVLAASGEEPGQDGKPKIGEATMNELEKALRKLLGDDSLALGAEGEQALAEKVGALAAELPGLREAAGKVAALGAELEALKASKAESEKKAAALGAENARLAGIEEKLGALELAAETAKKSGMIEAALAKGKVCKAQQGSLMKMDSVALAEFLEASPDKMVVPTGASGTKSLDLDTVSLSAEEVRVARSMGLKEEEMLAEKKRQLKAKEG